MKNPNAAGDCIALITEARATEGRDIVGLTLDLLRIGDDESLREYVVREAKLVATLAGFAGALAEALDSLAPGHVDAMFQKLALKYVTEGGES
jgi:hypothetical protein